MSFAPVRARLLVVLSALLLPGAAAHLPAQTTDLGRVDFRYSPPWWQTAICLPDDPDKILVGKEGQLLLDYGGGGVRNFGISIQPELREGVTWQRQKTISARAPIVDTWAEADGVEVFEEAFVVTPKGSGEPLTSRLARADGAERLSNWAHPIRPCAANFTGVEVAYGGAAIRLRLAAADQGELTVVFGLCEGWHKEVGQRPLMLTVEGGPSKIVDPIKDFGANAPGLYRLTGRDANHDGVVEISVSAPEGAPDRNAILNALWVFKGSAPEDEQILSGAADSRADACFPASLPSRRSVLLLKLKNTTATATTRQPALRIRSVEPVRFNAGEGSADVGATRITASTPVQSCSATASNQFAFILQPVTLAAGAVSELAFTVDRHFPEPSHPLSAKEALQSRDVARRWWEKGNLPFNTIQVPDEGIQDVVESCVRNIWQAREIKHGQPAFHVGPTVYRGLWVVDGSFLLETAALLGRGTDARAGVEYLLSHQKPDGSFDLLGHYWKENGIVLWAATRHAMLTQDKVWLRAHWSALQRVAQAIQRLRMQASTDTNAPYYRLLPPGTIDGGIGGSDKPEYSNTYWCLGGLKAAIAAAHWLGDDSSAAAWQKEFDDFYETWRQAAERDKLKDTSGNEYVPTMMGNLDHHVPARGQWAFCHAVYPGEVFAPHDALVEGQLAMLGATKVEGMVYDTGWMREGIWTYFASFYGHALLWETHDREAAEVLYAFAQHASPTRVWREEQKPRGKGNDEVGDMPHNWASAEFIRLTTHLLELDRGEELHLLEGFPREWAGPGMVTRLNGVLTPFGPLHLEVRISSDGRSARLKLARLAGHAPSRIVLHLDGLKGRAEAVDLPLNKAIDQKF